MSKPLDVIKGVLYEEKVKKIKQGIKLFYNVVVKIEEPNPEAETPPEAAAPEPVAPAPVAPTPAVAPAPAAPVAQESFKQQVSSMLNEETISMNKNGITVVGNEEANNIQTMEDLIDYLTDTKVKGEPIFDDFTAEVIMNAIGGNAETQLKDIVNKEDRIQIEIDYGTDKNDSVGFKLLKRSGVDAFSMMMKKDDNILPGKFNLAQFNNQLILYRNEIKAGNSGNR